MSMQDPIADMLVRIKNAQAVKKEGVFIPSSKLKIALADVLKEEGYIEGYEVTESEGKTALTIFLKYFKGAPVMQELKRASRPGLRLYKHMRELPKVMNGLGIAVVSTSQGLMSDHKARQMGLGGEILCYVS